MANGIKGLRRIQLVTEGATPGTPVTTATARLIGTLDMENVQKYYRPDDQNTGRNSSYERSYIVGEQAKLTFNADANYEQLAYILSMAIKGGVTPSGPTDSLYTWTYTPNLTSANSPTTYTMQYGDDIQAFITPFCFATDFELSGSLDAEVKVKANIVGQKVRTGTFTSLSNPVTLTPIITGTGGLYMDNSWANIGNTPVTSTLIDFTVKTVDGVKPVKYVDGNIYFSGISETKRHLELESTFASNSTTVAMYAAYIASPQTKQYIRLKFTGPLVGSASHKELDIDGVYVIDTFGPLTDRDGENTYKIKLVSIYDTTGSAEWSATLKNGLSALP